MNHNIPVNAGLFQSLSRPNRLTRSEANKVMFAFSIRI
jgi:hypothetical protein